jgi:DHA2 family multidrug resistance protein
VSTAALTPVAGRRKVNPWVVAVIVVVPTFMEVLDTTIANVALRYIAGGLATAQSDADWVITSYLAANAIVLPITGWLSSRLGRRNYFLLSITVFTLASAACGLATSLGQMILFRIIQGLAGGGLQPCSQGILLDSFPPEKQGTAMTLFGVAAVIGPIVGPTLGGWLCVDYNWRWIFLINVPIGLLALFAALPTVEDPEYLKKEREGLRGKPLNFDYIGLSLLTLVMASWEVVLSKGQEWDWFGDPSGRVQVLAAGFALCLVLLIVRELRTAHPIINLRVLKERNLAIACVNFFCLMMALYAVSMALPGMLQMLFGYDALRSGLAMSPAGATSMIAMAIAGTLLGRQVDARWLIAVGLVIVVVANYWMARMNLMISPAQVAMPRMLLALGLGLSFAPMSVAAFKYTPLHLRGAAVGISSLLRTEGGSVGTSLATTIEHRRDQFHLSRMGEWLGPLNTHVQTFLEQTRAFFFQKTGDPAKSDQLALQSLDDLRQQQAMTLAFLDVFWLCAVLALGLLVLVPFMKRSVAEKGEHIGAE